MPKRRRGMKGGNKAKESGDVPVYASDDEKLYGNTEDPDPDSREYMYDEIDEFHANREKVLIETGYQDEGRYEPSDEEEVLGLDSEESDDDEIRNLKAQLRKVKELQRKDAIGSDIEDNEDNDDDNEEAGLPDSKRWGKKRGRFYGDDEIGLKNIEDEEAEAVLEEKEALRLQRKMAEELEDQDFGLDMFTPPDKENDEGVEKEEKIVKDLSKLSKNEKLKLLMKESPELLTLIAEFKEKLTEVQDKLCPLRDLLQKKNISGKAVDYVNTKFHLNLNYCTNVLFYLTLKSKQVPVHNHPVIKRLLQYRNIMTQLESLDKQIQSEVEDIVARLKRGEDVELGASGQPADREPVTFVRRKHEKAKKSDKKIGLKKLSDLVRDSDGEDSDDMYEDFGQPSKSKKQLREEGRYETKDEQAALDYYEMMKGGRPQKDEEDDEIGEEDEGVEMEFGEDEDEDDDESKRAITYQIEKNKGLTASKKKELKNPRVKHRMKFRKAKIRRKGQIREPRTEMHKYGGEISGIRAGIKRGIKLR